jgi:hypothetical protein
MRKSGLMVLLPAAMLAAACGRNSKSVVDDGLKTDLALASQAQAYNPQATLSPAESNLATQPQALQPLSRQPTAAPVRQTSSAPRRSSSASRSRSGGSGSSGGGGYYPVRTPPTHVEKHTQRDAAIGAAAGAVLGATSSRNKIRGGLIGAAVGGILGGVIGNNVDVQRKTGW